MEFTIGDEVVKVSDPADTGRVVEGPESGQYLVKSSDGAEAWTAATNLRGVEAKFRWSRIEDFMADLALQKFSHKFSDVLFSMGSSRTQFLPYQFKPVLQFIQQQPHGLLIADEVGLGKTIEAALITRELLARGPVDRILVICPANLREKWQRELRERFGIYLQEMKSKDFQELKDKYDREGYWPPFHGVTSLEGLRTTDFESTLVKTGIPLDLVIIDEAHHMRNPKTRSFTLGEALSSQADHILLLSATPVQTGEGDLLSLLQLVNPAEFQDNSKSDMNDRLRPNRYINAAIAELSDPNPSLPKVSQHMGSALKTSYGVAFQKDDLYMSWLRRIEDVDSLTPEATVRLRRDLQKVHTLAPYYTRTRKREVQDIAQRRSMTLPVKPSIEEQEFYDAWNVFIRAEAIERNIHPGFYVVQPERQAASSIHVAREKVEERIASVQARIAVAPDSEYEGSDSEPKDLAPDLFAIRTPFTHLNNAINRLRDAAENLPERDSKIEKFVEILRIILDEKRDRKIICFTEWRGTLRQLYSRLQKDGIGSITISGEITSSERSKRIENFRQSFDIRVLISTEVGSEGLDLQFCDAVINYDLPWNPMRVEQRIGRIDRFGQKEKQILVVSFFVEGTIDTRVLLRLYQRIKIFEESIGQLESIMGPMIASLQVDILTQELSPEEQEEKTRSAILKIEQEKLDLEQLEESKAELMGQGDLLRQEVKNIRTTGRYISSMEVRAIVERWLAAGGSKRDRLDETKRGRIFDLHISKDKLREVFSWMQNKRTQPTEFAADRAPVTERLSQQGHAWVTFDSDVAQENPNLPFLHAGHEIVATAIERLSKYGPGNWISRVGRIPLPDWIREEKPPDAVDGIALAIYRVKLHGLEGQTTMLPVALSPSSGDILEGLSERLLAALSTGGGESSAGDIDEDTVRIIAQCSFEEVERRTRAIEKEAREQQDSRVAIQTATLRRSYEAKIGRSRQWAGSATDEGIKKLHEGRARNLQGELDDELRKLRDAPEPTADFSLLSMAIFVPTTP